MKERVESSWEVVGGKLDDVVTCQSSDLSIDDDDLLTDPDPHPLTVARPTSDSPPCEITVLFTQLYDIKQVYVRSTAKVYEIYCATNHKSDNQYLCTVKCGIAHADEVHSSTTDGDIIKDRFEATAEISDGDPVMSITLRLLSIQSGDYICIDEVYVFGDPVVSSDNHCPPPALETSPGGAMLSMFIPTLLRLSKSGMSNVQENRGFTTGEKGMNRDKEQHSTVAVDTSTGTVRAEVLPNMVHNDAFVRQPNNLYQTQNSQNSHPFTSKENDFTSRKIQQTLDELVSRVSRIEAFCVRFEENLLKPIINMETRLERVEQQLETFTKNSQFPRTGCTRYSAPDFSCIESESDSACTGGTGHPATLKSESSKKNDCCPQDLRTPTSDVYLRLSTSAAQPLPGLIISAPEYSSMDEEEEINSTEDVMESPKILKKPMSIDDALASALAGFATSALTKPSERTVTVVEGEIVSEVEMRGSTSSSASSTALARQLECTEMIEGEIVLDAEMSGSTSLSASSMTLEKQLECTEMFEEAENFSALVHSDELQLSLAPIDGGNTSSKEAMVTEKTSVAVISGDEETTKTVYGNNHVLVEGGNKMLHSSSVDTFGKTESEHSITGIECRESDHDAGQAYATDSHDSLSGIDIALFKDAESYSGERIINTHSAVLQDIIELPTPAKVDFSVALLDVSFSSLTSSSGKSSLESLLVDMLDLECEVPCVRKDVTSSSSEQYDLVVIEDESGDADTVDNKLLYVNDCDSIYMVDDSDSSNRNNQDVCGSLI